MKFRSIICTMAGIILIPAFVFGYVSPGRPTGYVNDFASVLSTQDKQNIENKLVALHNSTGAEVAVVTINSLGDETVESYANDLFQEWGIGGKEKDTGLLILVAVGDHKMRIEVGYGLEGTVTDIQSGNIIRQIMTPAFKRGDYAAGISAAVDVVTELIIGDPTITAEYSKQPVTNPFTGWHFDFSWVFFFVIIVLNVLAKILGKSKSWWLGGVIGAGIGSIVGFIFGFVFVGIIAIVVLTILGLIFDYYASNHPNGTGGGGFWFFGGRGGSGGGGFGGFGGGSSGGGGASGSW